jgi:hypothetical protein
MSTQQIRALVAGAYDGQRWKEKVKKMSDNQVVAVYKSLQKQGRVK